MAIKLREDMVLRQTIQMGLDGSGLGVGDVGERDLYESKNKNI
jgi:hypothetical protein